MFETFGSRVITSIHHVNCVTCFVLKKFYQTCQSYNIQTLNLVRSTSWEEQEKKQHFPLPNATKSIAKHIKLSIDKLITLEKNYTEWKKKSNPVLEKERLKNQAEEKKWNT